MMIVSRDARCPTVLLPFMGQFLHTLVQEYVPINTRGQSDKSAEIVGEVALIGKAGLQRRFNGRNALFQQFLGFVNANVFQVTVRRDAL